MTSPTDDAPAPLLSVVGLTRQFPGVRALDGVDLDLAPGEVHALVGENGAGKSTLIKILGGLLQPTAGTIVLDGRSREFAGPLQSRAAGISVIAQEFNLVPQLTVAENIFLGQEPRTRLGLVDKTETEERSRELLATLGLEASPRQRLEHLAVADRQLVEIAKALSHEFRVLVMDEPTAALNAAEVDRLLAIVDGLRSEGRSILYVSHRLGEIFRIADRVTVLRDGRRVTTVPVAEVTERAVVAWMLGRTVEEAEFVRPAPAADRPLAVAVSGLTIPGLLDDVSFDLRYGEVLGVAGLVGSGRSELSRALAGLLPPAAGEITVDGHAVRLRSPADAGAAGLYMLPEDRRTEGIFPDLDVLENIVIGTEGTTGGGRSGVLRRGQEERRYERLRADLRIRAQSPTQPIPTLSGGNQQKALFGRALAGHNRILVLNEPTRGVDVGAKAEIHGLIRRLAQDGMAVLVSSSDIPEVAKVSDRCLVLAGGRIVGRLAADQVNEANILASAVGAAGPAAA